MVNFSSKVDFKLVKFTIDDSPFTTKTPHISVRRFLFFDEFKIITPFFCDNL
ncbi:hypothetical protein SAMN05443633_101232 [Chryseobacterium arachidis]|uniref:Uncharacterized protein n=1 Tax=Chryseobacterium arachidis TaxID=1416778 RepID=A0A1M4TGA6_9FLAO|nr:hypothetical protein SAMN05443633_101232 [Chryseobacterium arachidis]